MEKYLSREEGINCSLKLKKQKLKTKKFLQTTTVDEQESSVQSADRTKAVQARSWENRYLPKPEN